MHVLAIRRPGQRGTQKLAALYGDRLVCVRYRYDAASGTRYKTVELIVDQAAWAPRMKSGMSTLYASSIKGKNAMPPKGGNMSLADADAKAAVDYLVGLAK